MGAPVTPTRWWAPSALLDDGWHTDVALDVDATGTIAAIEWGVPPTDGDQRLAGPTVPGMPNLHSHAFQRALAGLTQTAGDTSDSFWTWREVMYRFVGKLRPDDLHHIAAWLGVEMLEGGFSRVAEFHYLHHQPDGRPYADRAETAKAVLTGFRAAGIGVTMMPVLYQTADFGGAPAQEPQRPFLNDLAGLFSIVEGVQAAVADDPDGAWGVAPHSLRAVPPAALQEVAQVVRSMSESAPLHIHIAEQPREVEACVAWSGQPPIAWLLDHVAVDDRWCLVHGTHANPQERLDLARSGGVLGLCPTTEADLGDGIFALEDYLHHSGRMGVGTDSHVGRSAPHELALLELGQRLVRGGRNLCRPGGGRSTGGALWRACAAGGAQAMGQACGRIAVGHRADLLTLDPDHPAMVGRHGDTCLDSYIFADARDALHSLVVGGQPVVQNGQHPQREALRASFVQTLKRLMDA